MSDLDIITFGCRLNAFESEVMREHAAEAGLTSAVIVNTCAVTAEAVRQARQAIRRARRERPDAKIIVTGCAAQIDPGRFAAMDEVDHVIGNQEKLEAKTFAGFGVEGTERVKVNDIMSVRETAAHLIEGFGNRARAYVQIQNGCDHRCTFCIIPFGRGPSRSVPAGEVVAQVRRLAEKGYAEIVLTGVDITTYGKDLPGEMTLGKLTRTVLRLVPELPRLRLSSINSVEADPQLISAIAEEERLMPHLHLSLQAGDDLTLKRMKRRHARTNSVSFCEAMRRARPDIVFGADLIAGFPTETEAMFANSRQPGRRLRADLPACVSLFGAGRHAGRAHAASAWRDRRQTRKRVAREGRRGSQAPSRRRQGEAYQRADGDRRARPLGRFHAGADRGRAGPGRAGGGDRGRP